VSQVRVLLVDDVASWRQIISSMLQPRPQFNLIGEASDGLEAVRKAQQLQPDLILLDIGLPKLNGIGVAHQIRKHSPKSKILFFTENRSWDIAQEGLCAGAFGYVVKSDGLSELLAAVEAVLGGKLFVSSSLSGHLVNHTAEHRGNDALPGNVARFTPQNGEIVGHHRAVLYSHDRYFLNEVSQFIGAALQAGNAAIVVATDSHRDRLLGSLQGYGVDGAASVEQGRYIALDAADTLSTYMVNGTLESIQFLKSFSKLILKAAKAAKSEHPRVAFFGEGADLLWKQGNAEAAIQDEKLCNQLTKRYDVDFLCGYSLANFQERVDEAYLQRICAEHSAVCRP